MTREVRSGARETAYERGEEETLSKRQLQVAFLASHGIRHPQQAEMLGIELETVKHHWRMALLKTGTHNKTALVAKLIREGILP